MKLESSIYITLETLNKICDGLNIELKELFDFSPSTTRTCQTPIKLATVFSGIGAVESALKYLNYKKRVFQNWNTFSIVIKLIYNREVIVWEKVI